MAGFKTASFKIKNADITVAPAAATKIELITVLGEEPTTIVGYQVTKLDDVYSEVSVCYKV